MTAPVTRFAPSPTGNLHIGGARTALFNWLYARGHSGRFLLRIEDTDRARSTPQAVQAIKDGLEWLEIDWDGDCIFQHALAERHAQICRQLLANGKAYRCYATSAEIEEQRAAAAGSGTQETFVSPWRDKAPGDHPDSQPHVIRLRVPDGGETVVDDRIYGPITWPNRSIEDMVIQRSDGSPTYNFAVVVDDHDMAISHVIRGDDHLPNTPKQMLVYQAMGWQLPIFAHVPLIHDESGRKLSKRQGDAGMEHYRDKGYLPEAVRNYLTRLGWSHGNEEFFTTEQALKWFDLDGLRRSPARLDHGILDNLSSRHLAHAAAQRLGKLIDAYVANRQETGLQPGHRERLLSGLDLFRNRAGTIRELVEGTDYLASGPLKIKDSHSQTVLASMPAGILKQVINRLHDAPWNRETLRDIVLGVASDNGLKLGGVAPSLRAALTGSKATPGVFDLMFLLGKTDTILRIEHAADLHSKGATGH